jgi:hypothetical protein
VHNEAGSREAWVLQQAQRKSAGGPMSSGWPVYDNETQYRQIVAYLLPGETLYAVYDCKGIGTGFVGITDRRLIFYDQGIIAKKRMMVSLPYQNILGVAVADEGMIFQSGGDYHSDRFWSVRIRISWSRQSRLDLPFSSRTDPCAKVTDANSRLWQVTYET